jgi:glycerate kinase
MRILVACDSFKGSFSASEACRIVAEAIAEVRPDWAVTTQPLADGGEGTAEILVTAANGCWVQVPDVMGPLPGMSLSAAYAYLPETGTAIVEMARASGLALLNDDQRLPLHTTTYGTGQLLAAAMQRGAEEVLLTLGGSATVDGGTGAARALGWRFVDAQGKDVPLGGGGLSRIRRIIPPPRRLPSVKVLCDVTNRLCGPRGAAEVFAPQKGATPAQVGQLALGLENLAHLIETQLGIGISDLPGGGAAGGFGAGAVAFLGGRLLPGIAQVMERVRFEEQLGQVDWVITGEGCLDSTSLQGKVVSGVLKKARGQGVSVAVIAGQVRLNPDKVQQAGIDVALSVKPSEMPLAQALKNAPMLLERAAKGLAGRLDRSG